MEMDMDAAVSTIITAELNDRKSASRRSLGSALNRGCAIFDSKHVVESPPPSSSSLELATSDACGASLGPITPDSNRESVDYHLESTSPLSLPPKALLCFNSSLHPHSFTTDSPCTPRKDVFDSFAPGPDHLMLAPHCRKYAKESRLSVARQLKFESCSKFAANNDGETNDKINISEEETLFEALYLTILETIISGQNEDIAKVSDLLPDPDGFKTPTSAPHLSGVAYTCPRAPVKPTNKFRSIDKEICRKLEF